MAMQDINIQQLLEKYRQGPLSPAEEAQLEQALESGLLDIEQLEDLQQLHTQVFLEVPEIDVRAERAAFQEQLKATADHKPMERPSLMTQFIQFLSPMRLAYSFTLIALGIAIGWLLQPSAPAEHQMSQLSSEVKQVKELMMLTLLDKESSSERLKAVSMSHEIDDASDLIVNALFRTLNHDKNVNVRLATIEALSSYTDNPNTRQRLIKAIKYQESPLVQMALAELMVKLQEQGSVNALEQLLRKENVPDEIKTKIKSSIDILL